MLFVIHGGIIASENERKISAAGLAGEVRRWLWADDVVPYDESAGHHFVLTNDRYADTHRVKRSQHDIRISETRDRRRAVVPET